MPELWSEGFCGCDKCLKEEQKSKENPDSQPKNNSNLPGTNSDSLVVTLPRNLDFTLHANGDLTLRFPPGKWPSKSTVEAVTKLLREFEQTVKNITLPYMVVGQYIVSQHPTFELKIKAELPT